MIETHSDKPELNYNRLEAGGLFGRLKSAKEPGGKPEATVNRKHSVKAEGLNPVVETISSLLFYTDRSTSRELNIWIISPYHLSDLSGHQLLAMDAGEGICEVGVRVKPVLETV